MRRLVPALFSVLPLLGGCLGGEPNPVLPEDSEPAIDTQQLDTGPDEPVEQEVPIAVEWDPDDFYSVYDVGPDQDYPSPCDIPWASLQGGALVRIHWQQEPYRCKLAITTDAYENHPLVVMGVPAEDGSLPVITGEDAVTPDDLDSLSQETWVVQIGGSAQGDVAAWVWLQDLAITGARPENSFTELNGATTHYTNNAAALRIAQGHNLHLMGLELYGSHTGLFIEAGSEDIVVSSSWLHDNGSTTVNATQNAYSEAQNVTYEYSRFGQVLEGSAGSNLFDRSAGLVLRYNWFEGEVTPLKLHGSGEPAITEDPGYQQAMVYGNVIIAPVQESTGRVVVYGGDAGASADRRPGTLYFFDNTVISQRPARTYLLMLATPDQHAELHNNLVYAPGEEHELTILAGEGQVVMSDTWLSESYQLVPIGSAGVVLEDRTTTGDEPGFADYDNLDLHLTLDSPCQGLGGQPAAATSEHPVEYQYLKHQRRALRETREDLGAYEG